MVFHHGALTRCRSLARRFPLAAIRRAHSEVRASFDVAAIQKEIQAEHAKSAGAVLCASDGANALAATQYPNSAARWYWLDQELSSNMAGETGAVYIYNGAAAALKLRGNAGPKTLAFVEEHRAAEQSHLDYFEALLPTHKHTRLLPLWRLAGWSLGFAPALMSDRSLFLTVQAVETFVEEHYHEQIAPLRAHGRCPELLALLEHCCADEVHHKEDAAARAGQGSVGMLETAWMQLVRMGSAVAAEVARRV